MDGQPEAAVPAAGPHHAAVRAAPDPIGPAPKAERTPAATPPSAGPLEPAPQILTAGEADRREIRPPAARPHEPAPAPSSPAEPREGTIQVTLFRTTEHPASRRLELHLAPQELGRIWVEVEPAAEGRQSIRMLVEKPETLALLHQDRSHLENALTSAGVRGAAHSLTVALAPEHRIAPDPGTTDRPVFDERGASSPSFSGDHPSHRGERNQNASKTLAGGPDAAAPQEGAGHPRTISGLLNITA